MADFIPLQYDYMPEVPSFTLVSDDISDGEPMAAVHASGDAVHAADEGPFSAANHPEPDSARSRHCFPLQQKEVSLDAALVLGPGAACA